EPGDQDHQHHRPPAPRDPLALLRKADRAEKALARKPWQRKTPRETAGFFLLKAWIVEVLNQGRGRKEPPLPFRSDPERVETVGSAQELSEEARFLTARGRRAGDEVEDL